MENELFVIRPIDAGDFDWLYNITNNAGPGLTSWPNNKEFIARRIALVEQSISQKNDPEQRIYIFVQENLTTKKRMGVCGIQANVGYHDVFYNYQVSNIVQSCADLDLHFEHKIINLVNNFQSASELISFWIEPQFRGRKFATNLSVSRILYMAQFPELFGEQVIAEIRGVCDENGISPFWESLGKHFFGMDFATADAFTLGRNKNFIRDLIPREPIYLDLLPKDAQSVVGLEHPNSTAARKILEAQGFSYSNHIDIFDAGPLLSADLNKLKTVNDSILCTIGKIAPKLNSSKFALILNAQIDARFTVGAIHLTEHGEIAINDATAKTLQLAVGDQVRYVLIGEE